ncbi:MAG: hypothetical protein NVS4B3_10130 [Gemmatimonadaceae bacterium]
MLTETQERFLRAIVDQIALDRIAELHLFPPIRNGGVESGVAVVAAGAEGRARDEAPPLRFEVHTGSYRLTQKGPDRGKWAFELVAEADAPLLAIDTVVRGVLRRSNEVGEPDRLGPEQLAVLLAT